jgi:hypothetical protein
MKRKNVINIQNAIKVISAGVNSPVRTFNTVDANSIPTDNISLGT